MDTYTKADIVKALDAERRHAVANRVAGFIDEETEAQRGVVLARIALQFGTDVLDAYVAAGYWTESPDKANGIKL